MKVKDYAQNKLGIEAKKHLEPTFLKLEQQRLNAGNFWQFLNVVAKEQATFVELKEKYPLAIRAIDKANGDLKYTCCCFSLRHFPCHITVRAF